MRTLQIICPNGHLGFAPIRTESFELGVAARPDCIAADSGSDDVGPVPLGTDTSTSPLRVADARSRAHAARVAQARRADDHRLVGGHRHPTAASTCTCASSGSSRRSIACRVQARLLLLRSRQGVPARSACAPAMRSQGLDGRAALTRGELDATERIVAMAGVHPFIELLKQGADVIIGGRSSDSCVFAAPAIHHGFPGDQSYYLGKVLECASFCAEPYGGKETVLGEITADDVEVTAMHPGAALHGRVGGGARDVRALEPVLRARRGRHARHVANATTSRSPSGPRASPARDFVPAPEFRVKLEGAGKVGERYVGMVGIRDPYTIAHVDQVIALGRRQGARALRRHAATSCTTPSTAATASWASSSRCATARRTSCASSCRASRRRAEMAEEVCMIGTRQMFYARLPDVKGSAGSVAFRARRGAAREPGVSMDAQPHDALRRPARAVSDAHDDGRD